MDNRNDDRQASIDKLAEENKKWLDDLLNGAVEPTPEIQVDEKAVDRPDLVKPEDAELEKILKEDWSNVPQITEETVVTQPAPRPVRPAPAEQPVKPAPRPVRPAPTPRPVNTDMVTEEAKEAPVPEKEPVEKKGRPKKTNGYGLLGIPHILSTVIWLVLILAIGITLGRVLWVCCADVMAFGKEPQKVTITITADDDIASISQKLGDANLIRYPALFKFFAEVTGKDENISTGTFTLNSQLDYNAMINAMVSYGSNREVVDIMFPEGVNCAQIFKMLADKRVCSVEDLEEYAANGELSDYWFLEGVNRGDKYCLEGYLAPDTYEFYTNDSPRRVLEKFLNEFDSRFTDKMKENFQAVQTAFYNKLKSNGFGTTYAEQHKLTLHQVITLASVIQKETSSDSECYDIASVFYNRLANKEILSLGADATVYYAMGDYFGEVDELTAEHLNFDSPYNTRKYQGIPPGPICNMGVQALYAALEPNSTKYHYFVYSPEDGHHLFAVTYNEHLQNIKKVEN